MDELNEILSKGDKKLSDEELLKYLFDNTSETEKNKIEKRLVNSDFESDAIEGLQKLKDSQHLQNHVNQLHKKLQQQLAQKKQLKEKRKIPVFQWIVLAILFILFVCIMSYIIIQMNSKSNTSQRIRSNIEQRHLK